MPATHEGSPSGHTNNFKPKPAIIWFSTVEGGRGGLVSGVSLRPVFVEFSVKIGRKKTAGPGPGGGGKRWGPVQTSLA